MDKIGIYKALLQRIDDGDLFCLCPSLAMYIGGGFVLRKDFPEVADQQPKEYTPMSGPWFPVNAKGIASRRIILINAITKLVYG
jgi:hypothetical protein